MSSARCAVRHRERVSDHSPIRCERTRVWGCWRGVEKKRKVSGLAARRVILGEQVKVRERIRSGGFRERLPRSDLRLYHLEAKAAPGLNAGYTVHTCPGASCFGSRAGVVSSRSRMSKVVVGLMVCQSSIRFVVPPVVLTRTRQAPGGQLSGLKAGSGRSGRDRDVFGKRSGDGETSGGA